jgi:hypothetical protein
MHFYLMVELWVQLCLNGPSIFHYMYTRYVSVSFKRSFGKCRMEVHGIHAHAVMLQQLYINGNKYINVNMQHVLCAWTIKYELLSVSNHFKFSSQPTSFPTLGTWMNCRVQLFSNFFDMFSSRKVKLREWTKLRNNWLPSQTLQRTIISTSDRAAPGHAASGSTSPSELELLC